MKMKTLITGEHRRWVALAVICIGQLMLVLDGTIVNVALPSMQRDLGFSQANLAWVLDGYLIAFGSFLLVAGRLGDLLGHKRTFLSGVVMIEVTYWNGSQMPQKGGSVPALRPWP